MKSTIFKNRFNNEQLICDDIRLTEYIDDAEYIVVRRLTSDRKFLIRRDALEKINTPVVQRREQNSTKF